MTPRVRWFLVLCCACWEFAWRPKRCYSMCIPRYRVKRPPMIRSGERRKLVLSALETLAPEQRQVIELAYYSGLSHSEIAAQLGQPVGTVKTRTRLGMMKLYQQLHSLHQGRSEKI